MLPPLIQALCDPAVYPHKPKNVELFQTHISYVFVAGDFAYKVKKPVDLGFLDFSTLEKRLGFCHREVALNRRLAPSTYLGVVEITSRHGGYAVEGAGDVEEYAVKMRRLPQDRMMNVLLDRGEVTRRHIGAIVEVLAPFYEEAEHGTHIDKYGSVEKVKFNTDENFEETREFVSTALTEQRFRDIEEYTDAFLRNGKLFADRIDQGRIRDCHGDLHSGNICLAEETIVYDCIEFSHRFRYSDVAADVAFLAMDLDFRGRADLANYLVREISQRSDDPGMALMMPFYKCYRAYVRGKVGMFAALQQERDEADRTADLRRARRYFALAHRYTGAFHRPRIVVVFGLSGTGKSTVAVQLAKELGWPSINSDSLRKELAGLPPLEPHPEEFAAGIYSPEMTAKTYAAMRERAEAFLEEGQSVILDATFGSRVERDAVVESAKRADGETWFLLCECPSEVIRERLTERAAKKQGSSDADWEVYLRQKQLFDHGGLEGLETLLFVDSTLPPEKTVHVIADRFI